MAKCFMECPVKTTVNNVWFIIKVHVVQEYIEQYPVTVIDSTSDAV
jgi:hypothetical protein